MLNKRSTNFLNIEIVHRTLNMVPTTKNPLKCPNKTNEQPKTASKLFFAAQKVSNIQNVPYRNFSAFFVQSAGYVAETQALTMLVQDQSEVAFPLRTVNSNDALAENVSATDEKPRSLPIYKDFVGSHTLQHRQQIEAGKENGVLDFT